MIKSISFILLTQFFHFNELKGNQVTFFKFNQEYCFTVHESNRISHTLYLHS